MKINWQQKIKESSFKIKQLREKSTTYKRSENLSSDDNKKKTLKKATVSIRFRLHKCWIFKNCLSNHYEMPQ